MHPLTGKVLLISVPIAGVVGTGAYFGFTKDSISKETIKNKLEKEVEGKPRKILVSSSDVIWEKYKALYKEAFNSSKGISGVDENALPSWCEDTLSKEYSDRDIYLKASRWCVANTNTLKSELEAEGFAFITFDASGDSKWRTAWTNYGKDKGDLEITVLKDSSVNSDSTGGPKLKDWCKANLEKRMYENMEEDRAVDKVKKYCLSSRGDALLPREGTSQA